MAKYVCQVCGYVYEGDAAPAECPICHAPASKFTKQEEGKTWAAEHVVGVAKGAPEDIIADLRGYPRPLCGAEFPDSHHRVERSDPQERE